ncbi:glycosyltransferase [Marimonas sp. MJW-29]|uniref:Glycosyltransferase n=1 Tax=Sulfitobacter sediminis TaxID=3234186 RepID=A0ABV3RN21_9RHOB
MTTTFQADRDARIPIISVVSTVHGSRSALTALAKCVEETFQHEGIEWELVLVDYRGPDQPWPVIKEHPTRSPRIRAIRLARNHRQHLAIWAGLEATRGDFIAVINCHLQDDPSFIPNLYHEALVDLSTLSSSPRERGWIQGSGAWPPGRSRRSLNGCPGSKTKISATSATIAAGWSTRRCSLQSKKSFCRSWSASQAIRRRNFKSIGMGVTKARAQIFPAALASGDCNRDPLLGLATETHLAYWRRD